MSSSLAGASPPAESATAVHLGKAALRRPRGRMRLSGVLARVPAVLARVPVWFADAAMLATAAIFATTPVLWTAFFGAVFLSFVSGRHLYRPRISPRRLDTTRAIVTGTALATTIEISVRVFVADASPVAAESARLWVLATVLLVGGRLVLAQAEGRANRMGAAAPTLIVGAGKVGQLVAKRLRASPESGLRPVGFLDNDPLSITDDVGAGTGDMPLPVFGASWNLDRVVAEQGIRHVIVTFSTAPTEVLVRLLNRCEHLGVRTSFVPRLFEKTTEEFTVDRLGGLPLISTHAANPSGWQFILKYATDRVAAAVVLVFLSPLLGALALAVLLSSGRPILYRQERIGRDGRRFEMLKFRSMSSSQGSGIVEILLLPGTAPGGVEGADRRTRVGVFMRRTSLDELPQIFNVLRGEMSFVGPRPERPEYVALFEQTIRRYGERHRVKSGITGWAQVNRLRGKTSLADRAEWDNYYIDNWTLWFDFKILLQTLSVVARPGAVE